MKQKKKKKEPSRFQGIANTRLYNILVWTTGLAVIAFALLFFESDFLWKVQEMNLFQHTSLFFKQQMVMPGGMLTYLGTFLTQFLYYPWLGVLMIIGCWLLVMWLTKRAFRLPSKWALLMFVPVVLLLLTIVDMGYWVYILKLRGHFFVATLGTLFVTASLWAFRSLPGKYYLRGLFLLLIAIIGYPLAGIYGLAATLLMGILSWHLESKTRSAIYSLLAIIAVVAVPLICYRHLYHEINQANIYWAELPLYYLLNDYQQYYVPFYLLALFYVLLAITYRNDRKEETDKPVRWLLTQVVLLILLGVGAFKGWFKDENFHHELTMQHCVEQSDWQGILAEASKQKDEPTRAIVMMKNLALGRLGRQGNEMYYYKNGAKSTGGPFMMRLMQVIGPMIYYQYGMINYSARYSNEMGVEYEWRTEYLKNLTRCALLNGEWRAASKYINLLKQTTFHRTWAKKMEALIGKPEEIAKTPEFIPITHMMHFDNSLYTDQGYVEKCLMNYLAACREVDDPYFQEQALLASLWVKDEKAFWYHFSRYVKQHPNQAIPIHYQEAAYLYSVLAKRPDIDSMPISPMVKDRYIQFDQMAVQSSGKDIVQARKMLAPVFGNTFFYDYFLMSNLPEY